MDRFVRALTGDRRSAYRHTLKVPLRYCIRPSASQHSSESENVSELGIIFATEEQLSIGAMVDLLLEMPQAIEGTSATQWHCTGHVVRVLEDEHGGRRVGVQFDCYEVLHPETTATEVGTSA